MENFLEVGRIPRERRAAHYKAAGLEEIVVERRPTGCRRFPQEDVGQIARRRSIPSQRHDAWDESRRAESAQGATS
jgi:hypothetical protein